jgi:hypothetical protein
VRPIRLPEGKTHPPHPEVLSTLALALAAILPGTHCVLRVSKGGVMNKARYNFPKGNPITCIWIETGDPKQPLARVWMDTGRNFRNAANASLAKTEVEGIRLCA